MTADPVLRVVHDPRCLKPVADSYCWLRASHPGTCLPLVGNQRDGAK